jgi:hypothetical protein
MKTAAFSVVLLNAVLAALAAPRTGSGSSDCKLKESIAHPQGWVKQSIPVPAEHPITLRIGLPQSNFAQLEQHLVEISDPDHWRYGDHLSKAEVEELVKPHPESVDAVDAWLASHGISDDQMQRSPANDWVTLTVPVGLAEAMLDTVWVPLIWIIISVTEWDLGRNTTSGRTPIVVNRSCARRLMASPIASSRILSSFNPRHSSHARRPTAPRLSGEPVCRMTPLQAHRPSCHLPQVYMLTRPATTPSRLSV